MCSLSSDRGMRLFSLLLIEKCTTSFPIGLRSHLETYSSERSLKRTKTLGLIIAQRHISYRRVFSDWCCWLSGIYRLGGIPNEVLGVCLSCLPKRQHDLLSLNWRTLQIFNRPRCSRVKILPHSAFVGRFASRRTTPRYL